MKYDFYYSKRHDEHMTSMIDKFIGMPVIKDCFVNGIKYTEMIQSGKTPVTKKNFGEDLQLVYSGNHEDFKITHKTNQHNGNEF